MVKDTRGGPGRGQGLKKGTKHKNAAKKPSERRKVKKQVSYTQGEFEQVSAAMAKRGYTKHTEFARDASLTWADIILTDDGAATDNQSLNAHFCPPTQFSGCVKSLALRAKDG